MSRVLAIFTLFCVSSSTIVAQSTGVKGRILDRQGAVITGIEITATDAGKKVFRTVTSEKGEYSLDLPTGEYTLEIGNSDRSQFCPLRIKKYLVPEFNGFMTFDIILKIGKCSHCGSECKLKTIEY